MIEQLWKEYSEARTPETRERVIMACMPYIKLSAHRLVMYANVSQDVDDLISAGIIGLMDALEGYDPSKGASFKNYAKYRVRGSIMDEIRSMNWVPYSTREKAKRIGNAIQKLDQKGDKAPNEQDIAKAAGMSLGKYRDTLLEINRMTLSLLEDTFYDGEGPVASSNSPEDELERSERETLLGNVIENLPEQERLVVTLYYYEEMTMKEIGKALDISESRVCQIHSAAILRLHTRLKYADAEINLI